jgi:hypothetical protein
MRIRGLLPSALTMIGALPFLLGAVRGASAEENKFVGAEKCKNCHSTDAKGNPYAVWSKAKHSHAFATLATPEAKKVAAEKKIDDPQKSEACLVCHVTAFGVPADQKHKKFDETQGVQCESCHGPGGNHVKARLMAAEADDTKVQQVGKDEIVRQVPAETCKKCHNEKSPSYKSFCFKKSAKAIAHLDPRRNHPADYLDKLACDCPECKK